MASAGRPISITDDVWDGVMDGLLRGASIVSMARQYNISVGSIRKKKLPEEAKRIRALVEGERKLMLKKLSENASEIESLALNAHCSTSTSENPTNPISDIMSNIIFHLAIAAHRMAKATRNQVEKVNVSNPEKTIDAMNAAAACVKLTNDLSNLPLRYEHIKGLIGDNTQQPVSINISRPHNNALPPPA